MVYKVMVYIGVLYTGMVSIAVAYLVLVPLVPLPAVVEHVEKRRRADRRANRHVGLNLRCGITCVWARATQ